MPQAGSLALQQWLSNLVGIVQYAVHLLSQFQNQTSKQNQKIPPRNQQNYTHTKKHPKSEVKIYLRIYIFIPFFWVASEK